MPRKKRIGITHDDAMDSWRLTLAARNRSEGTIKSYVETLDLFAEWLWDLDYPDDVEAITPDHIRQFLAEERERTSPGTAHKQFRNLRAFYNWAIKNDERHSANPVRTEDAPNVPTVERPQLTDDQITALLDACKGAEFIDRRDHAIFRLAIDSGPRVSGMADMTLDGIMLVTYRVRIHLKGGDDIWVPIGKKTGLALDRYLRVRNRRPQARVTDRLWLGRRGDPMEPSGIYQMMRRRGAAVGLPDLHPHMFRRASATRFLDAGGTEADAMHIYGWKSPEMPRRYTRETARERARANHARLSPGDRL